MISFQILDGIMILFYDFLCSYCKSVLFIFWFDSLEKKNLFRWFYLKNANKQYASCVCRCSIGRLCSLAHIIFYINLYLGRAFEEWQHFKIVKWRVECRGSRTVWIVWSDAGAGATAFANTQCIISHAFDMVCKRIKVHIVWENAI